RRRFTTVALVGAIGLSTFVGCSSASTARYDGAGFDTQDQSVSLTREDVRSRSKSEKMPVKYVSEARIGLSAVEQQLGIARATDVEREAELLQRQAHIQARRTGILSEQQVAEAQAQKIRQEYSASQNK